MVFKKKKRKEGDLFTNLELYYIKNPKSVSANSRSTIKRRVKKKLLYLSKNTFIPALNLLSENERYSIALNFFLAIKPASIRELIKKYNDFENLKNKQLKIIQSWNEPNRLNKETARYENDALSTGLLLINNTKPIKNKKKFEEKLHKALIHPETILADKFTGDRRYICSSDLTKKVYFRIKKYKKSVKISDLLSKFKTVRERDVIKEFYRRGILLDKNIKWEDFLNKCRDLIKKGKFFRNVKSYWIEYDLDVFGFDEGYKDKEVMLTKICRDIDIKYYSL